MNTEVVSPPVEVRQPEPSRIVYMDVPPPVYDYDTYLAELAILIAILTRQTGTMGELFRRTKLTEREWTHFLARLYPLARSSRITAGRLARKFYDYERSLYVPTRDVTIEQYRKHSVSRNQHRDKIRISVPLNFRITVHERFQIPDPPSEPDWFEEHVEPVKGKFIEGKAKEADVIELIGRTNNYALDGPRMITRKAANRDPLIKGWARVEGNENVGSCAFCAMLISRGPVYQIDSFEGAARDLLTYKPELAASILEHTGAQTYEQRLNELMTRWHPHCDCQVVPVFDRRRWVGRDQFVAMQNLWQEVNHDENGRIINSGKDALNAFRRRLNRGDLPSEIRRPRAA